MATKEELFISVSPEIYRLAKSNTLKGQADLLSILKRLHNLTILARQKRDLKIKLHKLFTSVLSEIDAIREKMPTPKIPKTIQKEEPVLKTKESFPKRDDIEEELKLIQQKLRELNG